MLRRFLLTLVVSLPLAATLGCAGADPKPADPTAEQKQDMSNKMMQPPGNR